MNWVWGFRCVLRRPEAVGILCSSLYEVFYSSDSQWKLIKCMKLRQFVTVMNIITFKEATEYSVGFC